MMRRFAIALCIVTALCAWAAPGGAQWVEDGIAISEGFGQQSSACVCTYPEGLYYVTWSDSRNGPFNDDIYALAIGSHGGYMGGWYTNGTPVCSATHDQYAAAIVPDGSYGAIIVWEDNRNYISGPEEPDVYAQRIDMDGSVLWTADGVAVCAADSTQTAISAIPDDAGGAFITWMDNRSGAYHVYAQRIDFNGTPLWTTDGVAVSTDADNESLDLGMVSDGTGGAIIAWIDHRGVDRDIYAERLDADGAKHWYGRMVCTATGDQAFMDIASDGAGGAVIVWKDSRIEADIYAQRIGHDGISYWTTDGIPVCDEAGVQARPAVASDCAEGAIVAWDDYRSSNWDIYAARIDMFGVVLWTAAIRTQPDNSNYVDIMADGAGGAIIGWWNIYGSNFDIYAGRIDASGTELWQSGGYPVCNAPADQSDLAMAPDHDGGGFFAWGDDRADVGGDVYALRIERNGYWGYPAPNITAVRDVPGDQGGYVNLAWDASRLDPWPDQLITEYTVWRAIDAEAALLMAGSGAKIIQNAGEVDLSSIDPSEPGDVIRRGLGDGFTPYYWYLVATLEANHLEKYSMAVPTLFDSTAASSELHYFQVIAHAFGADAYWISDAESGYSVDNLAPCAPAMLAGEQQYQPEGLELTWDPNSEPDLLHYYVYRGTDETFVADAGNRIACTADTTTFDGGWHWSAGYWYKVSAVDKHGNESPFAVLGPDDVTGVDEDVPAVNFLAQNYPNPFNPLTRIEFGLAAPALVSLRVYDASGRLVRVLVDGRREANVYSEVWDGTDDGGRAVASGVYFYRLIAGPLKETKKMVIIQ